MERALVWGLAGQSNMEGRGLLADLPSPDPAYEGPWPDVYIWNESNGQTELLEAGVNNKSSNSLPTHGPELSIAAELRALFPDEPIYLVKFAVDGSSLSKQGGAFDDWKDENELVWTNTVWANFKAYLAGTLGLVPDLRGIFFQQGETDSFFESFAKAYEVELLRLVDYFRAELGADTTWRDGEFPFVHGLIQPLAGIGAPFVGVVNEAKTRVNAARARCVSFSTDTVSVIAPAPDFEAIHFDSAGALDLGRRFVSAWASVQEPLELEVAADAELPAPLEVDLVEEALPSYEVSQGCLTPRGLLWTKERDSNLRALVSGMAKTWARVDARAREYELETTPRTASELLGEWEAALGLPDEPVLQGGYLDLTDTDGTDDLRAYSLNPSFPAQPDVDLVALSLVAAVRPEWIQVGGVNGWKDPAGAIVVAPHYLFRRLNSGTNEGIRVLLEPVAGDTFDLGGAIGPALRCRVEIGDGSSVTSYTVAQDNAGELVGTYPLLRAFAGVLEGTDELEKTWGQVGIAYGATGGPIAALSGFLRFYLNGDQVGGDVAVPQFDRMLHAPGTEGVIVGANGTFEPWVGDVDQVRVYDRTLSSSEFEALFNRGEGVPILGNEPNLVFGWEFDGARGTPAKVPDEVNPGSNADLSLGADAAFGPPPGFVLNPDPCQTELAPTLILRRFAAAARLAFKGGQATNDFVRIAESLGFSVLVEKYDGTTCNDDCNDFLAGPEWAFAFKVSAPELTPFFFRVGESRVGETLTYTDRELLECYIEQAKPAQSVVLFCYDLDVPPETYVPWEFVAPGRAVIDFVGLPVVTVKS